MAIGGGSELTMVSKLFFVLMIILMVIATVYNIFIKEVHSPFAFLISIIGFAFFLIAKLSVLRKKRISFSTGLMNQNMKNLYRLGYWLMIVGIIWTFL